MGERTSLNFSAIFPSQKSPTLAKPATPGLNIDIILLLTTITLVIFGLLMVYSASWDVAVNWVPEPKPPTYFLKLQLIWLLSGIGIVIFLTFFDYHLFERLAFPLIIITIVLLIIVLISGAFRLGASRSLLAGSIQPSEMAKIATVIYLAVWLISKGDQINQWDFGLLPLMFILGLIGFLIYKQPDVSAALTVILLGVLLFFLAGSNARQIVLMLMGTLIVGAMFIGLSRTGQARMSDYRHTLINPTEASDHVQLSLGAFIKGGWLGVGIGKGQIKLNGLPFPHTDSIFSVIGEETGVIGATFVVCMFLLLMWRSMVISQKAPDRLGRLLAIGLGGWITLEALINTGVTVGLLPFAGNTLPFISYGGSSLWATLAAIGILLNISRLSAQKQEEKEKNLDAVVDLRRWNRRRGLPRSRRPRNNVT